MKPPENDLHPIQKENQTIRNNVQNTKAQRVADTLLHEWHSEFSLPPFRAVWSVVNREGASEEEARRRKRK